MVTEVDGSVYLSQIQTPSSVGSLKEAFMPWVGRALQILSPLAWLEALKHQRRVTRKPSFIVLAVSVPEFVIKNLKVAQVSLFFKKFCKLHCSSYPRHPGCNGSMRQREREPF